MTQDSAFSGEFVDDGYTLAGFIAGQPGVYDDLEFTYRPVSVRDEVRNAAKRRQTLASKSLSDEDRILAEAILDVELAVANVLAWNLTNGPNGRPVEGPPSVEAALRCFPRLRLRRLQDIVCLGLACDPRPDGTQGGSATPAEREGN